MRSMFLTVEIAGHNYVLGEDDALMANGRTGRSTLMASAGAFRCILRRSCNHDERTG